MTRTLSAVLVLLFAGSIGLADEGQDVIYLQDGRERVGQLVSMTADTIVFRLQGEADTVAYARDEVARLDLTRTRAGATARTVADLDDPLLARVLDQAPVKFAYPDSGYVTLYRAHTYDVNADGTYTLVERRIEKVFMERGKDQANVARYFREGEEELAIDFARTINPDGSVTAISDAGVDINSVHASLPEYDKLKQVKFAMKQIKVDSVIDYQVTTRRTMADLLDPFYAKVLFRADEPILEAELRVNVPQGTELKYVEQRLGRNVQFAREELDGRDSYVWTASNCPRVVPEPMMPPAADLYPAVTVSLPMSWYAIGGAYAEAIAEVAAPSEEIAQRVAELTADVDAPVEQAAAIYHDFLQSVRHLWVWPMQYSYAPRPAKDIFAKRAGNAIDKALLLAVMFEKAGLPAGVVLTRTQTSGKLLEEVPNIRQFDDAVVAVDMPTGRQYLALNDESVRFGQMPSQYQGTTGLLVNADGSELVTIPLNRPAEERFATAYEMELQAGGDLVVTKTEVLTGNVEIGRRNAWKDLKDEELRRQLEVSLTAMYPKARLDDYTIENLHDVTKPLTFTQTYTLVDYGMQASDELMVFQLPEVRYTAASVGKDKREFPLRWYLRTEESKEMRIRIPEGYRIYYAGKDYEADCGIMAFVAEFSSEDAEIVYRDAFVQKQLEADTGDYADYKSAMETRARVPKEWIVLERLAG